MTDNEILQKYPDYKLKRDLSDKLYILVCQIKVWSQDSSLPLNSLPPDNCLTINEVQSIEITDTFKNLINTAVIKFPRGTVIKKIITGENAVEVGESSSKAVNANISDDGSLAEYRGGYELAKTSDFAPGKRIKIKLGYTTDAIVAENVKKNKNIPSGVLFEMFDGFITQCSVGTPIEIKCENIASGLKKIALYDKTTPANTTINDLFKEGGKYDLLKGTGLKLYPKTEECEIYVGKVPMTRDLTVADIFLNLKKYKIYSFIKYDGNTPYIAVGRTYFSSNDKGKDSVASGQENICHTIQFDFHVAKDNLQLMNRDKNFVAVEAQMVDINGKFYKVTIRRNPEYDMKAAKGEKCEKYQLLNEMKLSKKAQRLGAVQISTGQKVDLKTYNVIPYMSRKIVNSFTTETKNNLVNEAIAYLEGYKTTGISGTLTVFGDMAIKTATQALLIDIREPQKNGYYLIEEVTTKFGVDGYRQTLKLPYRISDYPKSK